MLCDLLRSYTYCSQDDGATCGNATQACFCNEPIASMISSQVKYGTDPTLDTYSVGQEAGDYPVTVRLPAKTRT